MCVLEWWEVLSNINIYAYDAYYANNSMNVAYYDIMKRSVS